jgi:hypothetical protein
MFNKNYLGHNFEEDEMWGPEDFDYKCKTCGIRMFYDPSNKEYHLIIKTGDNGIFLSCEEKIIKNIIE